MKSVQELLRERCETQRSIDILVRLKHSAYYVGNNVTVITARLKKLYHRKYEITVQIRRLDSALFPKRGYTKDAPHKRGKLSFETRLYSNGRKTLFDVLAFKDTQDVGIENSEYAEIIRDSVRFLTPGQAEVINLRYNAGYTIKKISETCNIHTETVRQRLRRGTKTMRLWIRVRLSVKKREHDGAFDYKGLLSDVPEIFTPAQARLILLCDSVEGKRIFDSVELLNRVCYGKKRTFSDYRIFRALKGLLVGIKVPINYINALHPIIKRVEPKKYDDKTFMSCVLKACCSNADSQKYTWRVETGVE